MKIYIDGLFYRGSGIGRYYESLVKEFAKRGIKIYTCVPKRLKIDFERDFKEVLNNIEPIFVDYEKFSPKGLFQQSYVLKKLENKVDLFFYPHVNLPIYVPKNTVVTIHDLIPFTQFWDRSRFKKKIFEFYVKRAIKKSKAVITVSNAVASELKEKFGLSKEKIRVIYEFIDDKFFNPNIKIDLPIRGEYILFVGNRKRHKNLSNLVLAFNKIKDKIDVRLVIAGSKERKKDEIDILIDELNIRDQLVEFLFPSDEVLISLYKNAKLFVFPSLIEGFGLPPLEALALGTPVIASNIPVLREILGDDIACFNPYDIKDMADKLYRAITDDDYRNYLFNLGKKRLEYFDKNRIIKEYIDYFSSII